jgi:hypothetical protein
MRPESSSAQGPLAAMPLAGRVPEVWVDAVEDAPEEAWAAAAMTPAAPSAVILPARMPGSGSMPVALAAMPGPSFPRLSSSDRAFVPSPASDPGARITVPPVVATLPPVALVPSRASLLPRRRFSADSKLLAGGGALAAAMLVLALGVMLGQRTAQPPPAAAAATGPYPLVVETKAAAVAMPLPAAAVAVATGAAIEPVAPKVDVPLTIDVQQLPTARPAVRAAPAHVTPLAGASAGWTVATRPLAAAQAAKASGPAIETPTPAEGFEPVASAAAAVPEIPVTPPPPVDPLVQAVREDIREDETRGAK